MEDVTEITFRYL